MRNAGPRRLCLKHDMRGRTVGSALGEPITPGCYSQTALAIRLMDRRISVPINDERYGAQLGNVMTVVKLKLTLHGDVLDKPILHQLSRLFDVPTIVRYANVGPYTGVLVLDVMADSAEIEPALTWLTEQGVVVEVLEKGRNEGFGSHDG